jgi:hypothetical protein
VRAVIYEIQTLATLIEEGASSDDFDSALSALAPTVGAAVRRAELKSFLDAVSQRLTNQRLERLRAMPVDSAKIDRVRDAIRRGLLAHGPDVAPFHGFEIYRGVSRAAEGGAHTFGDIDKGQLVSPDMSPYPWTICFQLQFAPHESSSPTMSGKSSLGESGKRALSIWAHRP